jgi:beta-galactosidase/beta-glucuronidase
MKKLFVALALTIAAVLHMTGQEKVPRPEYPQPQFQREDWLTLNGAWQFDFDDANAGLDAGWATASRTLGKSITVPFPFESKLSGIGDTSFHPWVWYRRTFTIPSGWKAKRVLLRFGAVDYHADVWVNGARAGDHEGGNTPFAFDVTPLLKAGDNIVTVRAFDPPTDRYLPRGKQYWEPQSRSIFYTRTSGIWQPVWLEAVGDSYLESVRITATLDGIVRFDGRLARSVVSGIEGTKQNLELVTQVKYRDREIATASAVADGPRVSVAAAVANAQRWSTGAPNLYDVTFEVRSGTAVLDRVTSYFGFREIGVERNRVTLNKQPIYLKFVLDQGYWPDGILTAPTDEALQSDIRVAKEMGFNGARKHQKIEDPRFLYWADKMGFLISGEMANAYLFDEQYVGRFTREWMEAVERDYNHPSVIVWAPLNESWGTPDPRDARQASHLKALYSLTRSLDATRLVIDNEGWEHTDMTDLFAIHDYARTGEMLLNKYKDVGTPGAAVPDNARAAVIPGYRYNGTPVYLSEFGGIAFIPPGHQVPNESWGYSGVEKTAEAALARLSGLYGAIAKIPGFAGLCYTQLTDVEQEVNGLLTYDRKVKFDVKAIKALNDALR